MNSCHPLFLEYLSEYISINLLLELPNICGRSRDYNKVGEKQWFLHVIYVIYVNNNNQLCYSPFVISSPSGVVVTQPLKFALIQ